MVDEYKHPEVYLKKITVIISKNVNDYLLRKTTCTFIKYQEIIFNGILYTQKDKKKANFGIRLQLRFEIMTVCHKSS